MKKLLLTMACATVFGFAQAAEVTETLTIEKFTLEDDPAAPTSSYKIASYTSETTGIIYAGKMAKNSGMQFNYKTDSKPGLVATANPKNYKIVSVKVTPKKGTNTWNVYGKTTAYTTFADLYDTNTAGDVIGSGAAEATVTATGNYNFFGFTSKKGALYIDKIEITYTDGGTVAPDTREEAGLEFSATSAEATIGKDFTAPTLSKKTKADVTYSSDDEEVATVNPTTGAVTLVAEGTARITAKAEATKEYKAGSASYLLTVKKAPAVAPENAIFFSAKGEDFTFEHNATDYAAWSLSEKYSCLYGSAYKSGKKNATVDYAVSPVIDLAEISNAKLLFKQAFNYYKINNELIEVANLPQYAEIVVREEGATEWTKLATPTLPEKFSLDFYANDEISLAEYADKKIQVAFKYISTAECAGIWEVNEIAVTGTKDEAPVLKPANLKFAEDSVTIILGENGNIGDEIDLVTLDKETPAEAKYTSSNEEVVIYIATAGKLKIAGVGETTITATTEATEEYETGEATYTIIVKEAEEPDNTEAIYDGLKDNGNDWTIDNSNFGEVWSWDENGHMVAKVPTTAPATGVIAKITSPVINIEGYTDLILSFSQIVEGLAATDNSADYLKVLISVDGGDFTEVNNFAAPETEATWTPNTAALETVKGSTLQVRFLYKSDKPECKWMVKNVNVTGTKELQGIENVEAADSTDAVYYYNLQGVRVNNPENGIYIKVQGNKTSKVYIK